MSRKRETEPELDAIAQGIEVQVEPEPEGVSSIDKLVGAIDKLAALQMAQMQMGKPQDDTKGLMVALTAALERVSDNQLKGAEVIAQTYRQVHRPSNVIIPGVSVFHPRGDESLHPVEAGYVKPRLLCDMHIPRLEQPNDNMLTREETELLNILTRAPGLYVIRRIDDTKVKLTVKVEYAMDEVTPSKLTLLQETAFNREYFRLMPALHAQLRQMLGQHSDPAIRKAATEVLTMDEEMVLIQAGKLSVAA